MAIRITPDLTSTDKLLGEVLTVTLNQAERCAFLVPPGKGRDYIARIRVMLTRTKKKIKAKGKKMRQFTLQSTVHSETHDGKRFDCVVMWRKFSDTDAMAEHLEDLLSNG